jgi:hypothetical protein
MSGFYVYEHRKGDTGEVFYIGKGKQRRAYVKSSRNAYWKNVVKKHGYTVHILHENLSEEYALHLEKITIEALIKANIKLCNLTEGGFGSSGRKHTEVTKSKMRKRHLGKTFSEETKEKLRQSQLGRVRSEEARKNISVSQKGKMYSQEYKDRMRESVRASWIIRKQRGLNGS